MARQNDIDQLAINTIRMLAVDAVQKANSGHPGTPMDAARPLMCCGSDFCAMIRPTQSGSTAIASSFRAATLRCCGHLTGIRAANPSYEQLDRDAVTLEDIKNFRQAGSRCPGHPEYGWTSGVETTTGPLGQGVATSVGMAIAGQWLRATYNRPGYDIFDFNVYALCGDGDMMEGISSEAASLAGHLRLSNLCWIYDSNRVTIEGHTDIAFTEDVAARFLAYGWNVERVTNPNDLDLVERSYRNFLNGKDRPTLIIVHSHIGYGAPHRQDTPSAHGEPLGAEETRLTKEFFGFDPAQTFVVPEGVRAHFSANFGRRGAELCKAWKAVFARYRAQYPDLSDQIERLQKGDLPGGWDAGLPTFAPSVTGMSTRDASSKILNAVAERVPWLVGGAADLAPSTKTRLTFEFAGDFQADGRLGDYRGRNFHFGVREHAMCDRRQRHDAKWLTGLCVRIFDLHRLCAWRDPLGIADGSAGASGYNLVDAPGSVPDVILIGSGSEVSLCVAARDLLATENIGARVVSMPSWELFDAQEPAYQQSVLPPTVTARVTVDRCSRGATS
jgi:transketolase